MAAGKGALQQSPECVGQIVVQVCSAADACFADGLGNQAEQFVFEQVCGQKIPVVGSHLSGR